MLPVVIIALIIAKIKKYSPKLIFVAYPLYPFFCVEIVYIIFQICIMNGFYNVLQYSGYLKSSYLFLLIIPIIAYGLYKPALIGSAFIVAGTVMNKIVIYANGGKMPVFATLSRLTGYYSENTMTNFDSLHIAGNADTKLKILSDYIDIGYSILSLGDIFIRVFVFLIVYYTIRTISERRSCSDV